MQIRSATSQDTSSIYRANELAFGRPDEAQLVERLRADGDAIIELVAFENNDIVGHILFTRLPLEGVHDTVQAAALAPLVVLPERQRQGVGSKLVREGLLACRALQVPAVVVLGHNDYYPRFGFTANVARNIRAPFSGPNFMALEITPGVLGVERRAKYAAGFQIHHGPEMFGDYLHIQGQPLF